MGGEDGNEGIGEVGIRLGRRLHTKGYFKKPCNVF